MHSEELVKRFTYHPPKGTQANRYENIRDKALMFAMFLVAQTPESREQALALTHLDLVVMWANAAIARRENESPES
uniref:Acb2/Tad1 hairpin domain-containing protein n=1 Tax=viral metagenome TaxID=1070528 RepID=A0A6M3IMQ8_9ZZZZ